MRDALLTVLEDVVAEFLDVLTVRVAVDGHALAALSTEQLVQGHVGEFALDIPQRHVDARNGIVLDRAIAPIGVLMHELPEFLDGLGIAADEQRTQVFLDKALHHEMAVREGGTTETIEARLVGFDLDDDEIDTLWRGQDDFEVGNQRGHLIP